MRIQNGDLCLSIAVPWLLGSTTISPIQQSNMLRRLSCGSRVCYTFLACLFFSLMLQGAPAFAVPMQNDPNGFEGIPWGASFSETETFVKIEDIGRSQTYELRTATPSLGAIPVGSMRFVTSEGKFARVIVRYQGSGTHDRI